MSQKKFDLDRARANLKKAAQSLRSLWSREEMSVNIVSGIS